MSSMQRLIFCILWIAFFTLAQDEEIIDEIVTLTGSDRRLTGNLAAVTISMSDFEAITPATSTIARPTGSADESTGRESESSTNPSLTQLVGGRQTRTRSENMTDTTTTAPQPSNTQPCNNYPEFCTRRYSNITEVCAHNSPFTRKNNAGSNQALGVTQQLNDGIRMLQGQIHYVRGTLYYCHTSCLLLNAGTVEDYLHEVTKWVSAHPFDVVTIIFGNADYEKKDENGKPLVTSQNFVDPIERSGLRPYIYQPPKPVMSLEDWPTLSELIISGKRVITFIDYNFDTDAVPYLLWEFYNIWETRYSPTDPTFPCTLGRPEGISAEKQREMMYIANHNLNVEISIGGINLLMPNTVEINVTNGLDGKGSLGLMANQCTEMYDRPPNFLLVDYYNEGPFNGSVFEVAARANNVTYNRKCCGHANHAASQPTRPSDVYFSLVIAVMAALI